LRLIGSQNDKYDQKGLTASGQNSLFKFGRCLLRTIRNVWVRFSLNGVSLTFCTYKSFQWGGWFFSAEKKIAQARA
jgi:hypothetical protein